MFDFHAQIGPGGPGGTVDYTIKHGDHGTTLEVRGEIDLSTAERFAEALALCMRWEEAVAIDLSGVDFMDSSGIRVLIRAGQRLNGQGPLKLRAPQPAVERVLAVTRLTDLPTIEVVTGER
jgi:anti-sigma B factor antagonist